MIRSQYFKKRISSTLSVILVLSMLTGNTSGVLAAQNEPVDAAVSEDRCEESSVDEEVTEEESVLTAGDEAPQEAEGREEVSEEEPYLEEIVPEDLVQSAASAGGSDAADEILPGDESTIIYDNLDEVKEVPDDVIGENMDTLVGADGITTAKAPKYIPTGHKSGPEYKNYHTIPKIQSIGATVKVTSSDGKQTKDIRKYVNGCCWTFTACGGGESSYNIRHGIYNAVSENRGLTVSDNVLDLSERCLTYYSYFNDNKVIPDPLRTLEKDSNYLYLDSYDINTARKATVADAFALSGSPAYSLETMAMGVGIADEKDVPYSSEDVPDRNLTAVESKYKFSDKYDLKEGRIIDMAQKDLVKEMILKHGGVSTCIYYASTYPTEGGVQKKNAQGIPLYNNLRVISENNAYSVYYHHPSTAQNHNVLIIGWDDTIPPEYFAGEAHKSGSEEPGGWLCKNSYGNENTYQAAKTGKLWGYEYGYFWMSYDTTDKLLANNNVRRGYTFDLDVLEGKDEGVTENRTYQYDGSAFSKEITAGSSYANVYKVKKKADGAKEYLRSVMVKLATPGSVYSVQVYADPELPDPTTGTPLLEAPVYGKVDAAGYYDVNLGKGIELKAESTFAVVVNLYKADVADETPGIYSGVSGKYTMSVVTNSVIDPKYDAFAAAKTMDAMYYCLNSTNTNHSLLYNTATRQWEDMFGNEDAKNIHGNLRIKLKTVIKTEAEAEVAPDYTVIDHFEKKIRETGTVEQPIITMNSDDYDEETGTTILYVGQTAILKISGVSSVNWSSKKEKIATVDQSGLVTAVKKGVTVIRGTVDGKEYKHRIMVRKPSFVTKKRKLTITNSAKLVINGPYQQTTWTSTKPDIVSVDENGNIVALKAGSAQIKAMVGGTTLKCKVIVPKPAFTQKAMTLAPESSTRQLKLKDKSIDLSKVTFVSTDPTVAEVDEKTGLVTARATGKTVVTARVNDGTEIKCKVNVLGY